MTLITSHSSECGIRCWRNIAITLINREVGAHAQVVVREGSQNSQRFQASSPCRATLHPLARERRENHRGGSGRPSPVPSLQNYRRTYRQPSSSHLFSRCCEGIQVGRSDSVLWPSGRGPRLKRR